MRRVLPSVLVVLATFLAFLAIFALWANRQLLNTDNWTETSTEVLENQDVQEQLSIFLVDELYTNVDVQARIQEALPPGSRSPIVRTRSRKPFLSCRR